MVVTTRERGVGIVSSHSGKIVLYSPDRTQSKGAFGDGRSKVDLESDPTSSLGLSERALGITAYHCDTLHAFTAKERAYGITDFYA